MAEVCRIRRLARTISSSQDKEALTRRCNLQETFNLYPKVLIVGGGCGGLSAAKELAGKPVRVTLVDRTNHHLFQPLLYEVATAGLSPA
jgi:heterodisulfide reductase subunit A-like polyferredoxin